MKSSHQPGLGLRGWLRACDDADSPVWSSTALSRAAESSPQVSYAIVNSGSSPPQSQRNGCAWWKVA